MKMRMKRIMGLFLALAVSIGCLSLNPIVSYANDTNTKTFNINDGSVNITKSGIYTINGTGQATPNTISVTGSNIKATITLNNVNIDIPNSNIQPAFCAKGYGQSNIHLTIKLKGTNSLKSSLTAGLYWTNSDDNSTDNSTLEIKGDGSLTATSRQYGAGIGGGNQGSGENITIAGGTVTATGGEAVGQGGGAAGIGGGSLGSGKNITITGGTVTAVGRDGGAGIGGGWMGSGKNITITGGSVKASRIGTTPTDGKGHSVYLAKLKDQDSVNKVTVDSGTGNAKTFTRADNHPGGDTAFYLYLTGQDHDLVTSKGIYNAEWNNTTNAFTIIKFDPDNVKSMTVTTQPKLDYTDGDPLDLSGIVVKLEDTNGATKYVHFNEFTDNKISATPENGTPLKAALTGTKVKLTKGNASVETKPLRVTAKYKVTYKDGADGKAFGDQVKSVVTGDDTPGFTGTPTRQGYVFAGWDSPVADKVTADATYTATWKEDKNHNNKADEDEDKYTVTYTDGVDGKVFPDQKTSDILSGTKTPAFNGTPTRAGYVFAGWNPAFTAKVTADVKYVAQWKKDHFTVTFKDGDKTQTVKVKNGKAIDKDELIDQSMPKNPTKAGYTFKEWNTKEDGKGEKFTGASVVKGDMTVYAIYTKDSVPTLSPLPDGDGAGSSMNDNAPTTVDKDELNIQIDSAESDYKPGHAGDGFGAAIKQSADMLDEALAQAKRVAANPNATQAQVDAAARRLADARKSQHEAPAPKPKTEAPAPKSQREKRIGMIHKKGESASFAGLIALYAGLIAVLGFSIAGLAILLRRK